MNLVCLQLCSKIPIIIYFFFKNLVIPNFDIELWFLCHKNDKFNKITTDQKLPTFYTMKSWLLQNCTFLSAVIVAERTLVKSEDKRGRGLSLGEESSCAHTWIRVTVLLWHGSVAFAHGLGRSAYLYVCTCWDFIYEHPSWSRNSTASVQETGADGGLRRGGGVKHGMGSVQLKWTRAFFPVDGNVINTSAPNRQADREAMGRRVSLFPNGPNCHFVIFSTLFLSSFDPSDCETSEWNKPAPSSSRNLGWKNFTHQIHTGQKSFILSFELF